MYTSMDRKKVRISPDLFLFIPQLTGSEMHNMYIVKDIYRYGRVMIK